VGKPAEMGKTKDDSAADSAAPALEHIHRLLEAVRGEGEGDSAWELGIYVEGLAEALKERDLRIGVLEEEKRAYQTRLERGNEEYVQLRESMNELLDLYEFSDAISTSFKLEDVLDAMMNLSRRFVDYESCGVFALPEDARRLEPLAGRGDAELLGRQVQAQWEEGILDWIAREGRPVVVEDMESFGHSFVVVPLRVGGKRIGVYSLYTSKAKADFTAGELEILGVIASQAAVAIENAQLYTDLERAHGRLKESQRQLLLSDKLAAVGELAGGVAHEVNNPLQIILSRVQLMRMRHSDNEGLCGDFDLLENNVKRISRIIRALLGFARHNAVEGEWGEFDLKESLQQSCALVRHQLQGNLIELELDCPDDLPRLPGNAGELEQVFINLLLNAQNAMPDGGRMQVRARDNSAGIEIRFADSGCGIEAEHLDRIFEPFFTTRSDQGGTGLGLAVSFRIIEVHGGSLTVESQPGQGSTFIVRLPLEESGDLKDGAAIPAPIDREVSGG
jgi:signal transduction histidine kinase